MARTSYVKVTEMETSLIYVVIMYPLNSPPPAIVIIIIIIVISVSSRLDFKQGGRLLTISRRFTPEIVLSRILFKILQVRWQTVL